MQKLKERVLGLLKTKPETRTSDSILMTKIWTEDMEEMGYSRSYGYIPFLRKLMCGHLTNWESATRIRRKLQADNPELRDNKVYMERKQLAEDYRTKYSPYSKEQNDNIRRRRY
jgi:hypothetical protein|tara:strand:+ start:3650 stop:3991 length:342 start_codon:yes stop_codon:yes gene_type:complete